MASNYNNPINILDSTNAAGIGSGGSLNVEGGISVKKDTFIGGSLSVSGTSTAFSDNILVMNQKPVSSKDTGILFERYSNDYTDEKKFSGLIYSESSDEFIFGYANSDPNTTGITFGNYIPIKAQQLLLMSTENATSLTSGGSLTVLGGASISKSLNTNAITTGTLYLKGDVLFETTGNIVNKIQTDSTQELYLGSNKSYISINGKNHQDDPGHIDIVYDDYVTFNYKKEKYNWTEEDFKNFNLSRAVSVDNMIKKYGNEDGLKKWNDYLNKQKNNDLKIIIFNQGQLQQLEIN